MGFLLLVIFEAYWNASFFLDRTVIVFNNKENCYWATFEDQANNRRGNRILTYKGKDQTIAQWSRELGFNYNLIWLRLSYGWPLEKTLTTPPRRMSR